VEIYEYAVRKSNGSPEDAVMIGADWIADVQGAKSYGMQVVFFDVFKDNFHADGVTVIKNLSELQSIL